MTMPAPPGPAPLRYRLALAAYAGLLRLALPRIRRYFRRRAAKDPAYGVHMEEREGGGGPFAADVWVHSVSMGEMKSAEPLVRLLLDEGRRVVTTHATPAGRRTAETAFGAEIAEGRLAVRYAPVDLPGYWDRFLAGTRPGAGVVMEMEFWPAMIEAARRAGVPLCLANSQVPSRSYPRARRVKALLGANPAGRAAAVFAKSDRMADRFRALGAERVEALGETRFDIPPPPAQVAAGGALKRALGGRKVLTLASVVAGEEETYLEALRGLADAGDAPFVIWVPRAPELFDATAERLRQAGLAAALRSEAFGPGFEPLAPLDGTQVLVGNSMGEMFFYLAAADAVVVGGGFVEKGAHNVIEPLALGKPVITGPHVWTIEFPAVEAEAAGVLTVCRDAAGLPGAIRRAMADGGGRGGDFHASHSGASARIAERIRPLLDRGPK